MRLVKSFAREPYELQRYAAAGDQTMDARIAHHVAAVAVLGRRQHDHDPRHGARADRRRPARACDGQMTIGEPDRRHRLPRRRLRAALGDRAHDRPAAGRHRRRASACGRCSRCCRRPSTRRTPIDATARHGATSASRTSASRIRTAPQVLARHRLRGQAGRDGRARRPDRRRQDDARQPDPALLRRDGGPRAGRRRRRARLPRPRRCASRSRSCCRTRCCSRARSPTTCATAGSTRPAQEIEEAARAAHAHEFIARLPKGYDTEIAEAGGGLSGGERQRLSVARAILKNAPILILDEPTSSLDAISEEIVFAALRRLRAGRTTIVIAHRLVDRPRRRPDSRARRRARSRRRAGTRSCWRRASSTAGCARGCRSASRSTSRKRVDELIEAARDDGAGSCSPASSRAIRSAASPGAR